MNDFGLKLSDKNPPIPCSVAFIFFKGYICLHLKDDLNGVSSATIKTFTSS